MEAIRRETKINHIPAEAVIEVSLEHTDPFTLDVIEAVAHQLGELGPNVGIAELLTLTIQTRQIKTRVDIQLETIDQLDELVEMIADVRLQWQSMHGE